MTTHTELRTREAVSSMLLCGGVVGSENVTTVVPNSKHVDQCPYSVGTEACWWCVKAEVRAVSWIHVRGSRLTCVLVLSVCLERPGGLAPLVFSRQRVVSRSVAPWSRLHLWPVGAELIPILRLAPVFFFLYERRVCGAPLPPKSLETPHSLKHHYRCFSSSREAIHVGVAGCG